MFDLCPLAGLGVCVGGVRPPGASGNLCGDGLEQGGATPSYLGSIRSGFSDLPGMVTRSGSGSGGGRPPPQLESSEGSRNVAFDGIKPDYILWESVIRVSVEERAVMSEVLKDKRGLREYKNNR